MKNSKISNIIIINVIIIVFVAVDLYNIFSQYIQYTNIINNNVQAVEYVKDINSYMQSTENNILYSINAINNDINVNVDEYIENINMYMEKCNNVIEDYKKIDTTELEKQRFELFEVYLLNYNKKVESILNNVKSKQNRAYVQDIYTQELLPVKNCLDELLEALNDLSSISSQQRIERVNYGGKYIGISILIMAVILLATVNILNKRQKLATAKLMKSNETIIRQKTAIQNTTFKDIITSAYNRMSFLTDFSDNKKTLNAQESGYFIMFNIDGFHRINFNYSSDIGDIILDETVKRLSSVFNENRIYRTGSDEFVTLVKTEANPESYNQVISLINNAKTSLSKPYQLNPGIVNLSCSISCVYVNGACILSSELLETASEAIKQGRMSGYGNVTFINTENNQSYLINA